MHSRFHSRRASCFSGANVSIGDDFQPEVINSADTSRRLREYLQSHGKAILCKDARKRALWQKCRSGKLSPDVAANVERDNRKLFAAFDLEAKHEQNN